MINDIYGKRNNLAHQIWETVENPTTFSQARMIIPTDYKYSVIILISSLINYTLVQAF